VTAVTIEAASTAKPAAPRICAARPRVVVFVIKQTGMSAAKRIQRLDRSRSAP
jgi:hypothetical protein